MSRVLNFRWDEKFVSAIDKARGDVSRSLWVRRAVEARLALGDDVRHGGSDIAEARTFAKKTGPKMTHKEAVTVVKAEQESFHDSSVLTQGVTVRP